MFRLFPSMAFSLNGFFTDVNINMPRPLICDTITNPHGWRRLLMDGAYTNTRNEEASSTELIVKHELSLHAARTCYGSCEWNNKRWRASVKRFNVIAFPSLGKFVSDVQGCKNIHTIIVQQQTERVRHRLNADMQHATRRLISHPPRVLSLADETDRERKRQRSF